MRELEIEDGYFKDIIHDLWEKTDAIKETIQELSVASKQKHKKMWNIIRIEYPDLKDESLEPFLKRTDDKEKIFICVPETDKEKRIQTYEKLTGKEWKDIEDNESEEDKK